MVTVLPVNVENAKNMNVEATIGRMDIATIVRRLEICNTIHFEALEAVNHTY
jgi:hypothetical protein